jgi:chaperonin GroEL
VSYLEKNSSKVEGEKIKQVATISANNDSELGKVISDAFIAVDKTGIVIMEVTDKPDTSMEKIEGLQYDKGFINGHFITNPESSTAELDNPLVLILESRVENIRKLLPVLEHIQKENEALLIIGDLDMQVAATIASNKIKGVFKANIIEPPSFGVSRKETLDDIALLTGATVIDENIGDDMDLLNVNHLGRCNKAVSTEVETIIQVDKQSDEVKELISTIEQQMKETPNPNLKIRYEKRLARLLAKVAIVKVGANSEVELKEKKDRVEDAICATKAAIKEGIVPGGGIALLNASQNIKPESIAEMVLLNAISAPYETILENAGIEDYEMPRVKGKGLDVVTGKTVSMVKSGIIDPLLVTKSALMNAASVATTILSTDCVINNLRA